MTTLPTFNPTTGFPTTATNVGTISAAGTYTVVGSLTTPGDYQDWFQFTIASGFQLSNVTYSCNTSSGFSGNWNMNGYNSAATASSGNGTMSMVPSSGFAYPFASGLFFIEMGSDFAVGNGYTVTITVTAATPPCTDPDLPTLSATNTSFCTGGNTSLSVSGGSLNSATNWYWYTGSCGGTLVHTGGSAWTANPTSTTTYYVRGEGGCVTPSTCQSITITVNQAPLTPTITPGGPTTFCQGGSVTLSSSASSGNTWSTTATTQSINVTSGGTFTVTATSNGCTSPPSPSVTVTVNPIPSAPSITAGGPTTFCQGGSVTLSSSASSGNTWSTTATTQGITVNSGGTYTVTTTNGNGCTSPPSAGTTVTVNPLPATPTITAGGPISFCQGGSVTLTSSAANGNTWNNSAITQSITVNAGGTYSVYTTNGNGCISATSAGTTVSVNPLPTASTAVSPLYPMAGQEIQTIYLNYPASAQSETITVTPSGGSGTYGYSWTKSNCNATTLNPTYSNTTASAVFSPVITDTCSFNGDNVYTFTATVIDSKGCTASSSKKVNVVNPYVGTDVQVCHKVAVRGASTSQLLVVAPSQVATHLSHGDGLGNCPQFLGKMAPVENPMEVLVYPNPTTGVFIVELSKITEQADITITDLQGKMITHTTLSKNQAPTATISLTDYAAGMYLIQVRDGDMVYRSKIVLR